MPRNKCIMRYNAVDATISQLIISVGRSLLYGTQFYKLEITSPRRSGFRRLKNALVSRDLPSPNLLETILCRYTIRVHSIAAVLKIAVDIVRNLEPIFYQFDIKMRHREDFLDRYSNPLQDLLKILFPHCMPVPASVSEVSNNDKIEMLITSGALDQETAKKIDETYRDPVYLTVMDQPVYFLHDAVVVDEKPLIRRHYEYIPILSWIRLNKTDPFTRREVAEHDLRANPDFKKEIDEFVTKLSERASGRCMLKLT